MCLPFAFVLFSAALMSVPAIAQGQPSPPAPEGIIHVITYVETSPDWLSEAQAAMRTYVATTQKEAGSVRAAVFQETGRNNRFVVDEAWTTYASFEAHSKSSTLGASLAGGHLAPPDMRVHTEWSVAPGPAAALPEGALIGFTHIDVPPPRLTELEGHLRPFVEKSRQDAGVVRFEILQGLSPRKNHLTLAEVWTNEAAFGKHQASSHAIEFRDRLGPILGALYDQRFYHLMK